MIRFPVLIFRVTGKSMEPYAHEGDYAVSTRFFFKIRKGDVVVFREPERSLTMIKRVTETRRSTNGEEYYVSGDNNARSTDSRAFGYIKKESIIAKVFFLAHRHSD